MTPKAQPINFWTQEEAQLIGELASSDLGLSSEEAAFRQKKFGPNEVRESHRLSKLRILWNQLKSHLLWILIFAALVSLFLGEWVDATIIILILSGSVGIGYAREYKAQKAAAGLRSRLHTKAKVMRNHEVSSVDVREIVPGDIILLSAGNIVPADARILDSRDLFVNEAVLTGESFPVEKKVSILPLQLELSKRSNCLFLGTNVRAGTARCLVVKTGLDTTYGTIAQHLTLRPPETEFDRGIRRFGDFLTASMFILTILVFAGNIFLQRSPVESLLFSIALAVGLSPELLPAILNINLARGAQIMADRGVIVRNLNAIENLGSMTVLCTDKTGTLTEGVVELEGAYDVLGKTSENVLQLALTNANFQTGLANPLDEALLAKNSLDFSTSTKIGEVPYDFVRKRMSVIIRQDQKLSKIITKGAFTQVLDICSRLEDGVALDAKTRSQLTELFHKWTLNGIRVLAVASKSLEPKSSYGKADEIDLAFVGFLTFIDRPKDGASAAILALKNLGVSTKMISGDAENVAKYIAKVVGLDPSKTITGQQLDQLKDEALWHMAARTDVFAEVDPNQKERIILSLKKMGCVVGFLGDGVNDAPAMHAADTSISVEHAVEVAREVADFVLLEKNLDVIRQGIEEGRKTFANTLKYVLMTTSANLGNMLSMAIASLFLPFLPLLASQVLLNNFLSDLPAIGLANDNVDEDLVARPERWDMTFISRFMIAFGLLSSIFDFLTFGVLVWIFSANDILFRTGWFVESLLTELAVAFVIRTRRPIFKSQPGQVLVLISIFVAIVAWLIPFSPFATVMGFSPMPMRLLWTINLIVVTYLVAAEMAKALFYRYIGQATHSAY